MIKSARRLNVYLGCMAFVIGLWFILLVASLARAPEFFTLVAGGGGGAVFLAAMFLPFVVDMLSD